jgi:glycosidase
MFYDPVGYDKAQFDWYQKLIGLRKAHPVLSEGSIEFVEAQGKRLAYKRKMSNEEILVIFNAGGQPEKFSLPDGREWENLLEAKATYKASFSLPPLSSVVLKPKTE